MEYNAVPWRVRAARQYDMEKLALVGAGTFLETFAGVVSGSDIVAHCRDQHSADAYRGLLNAGANAWLAEADEGSAPIGYALCGAVSFRELEVDERDWELKRIYSFSRFHGMGIGPALLTCAIEAASRRRARRLMLGVYSGNARAIAFYRKHDFESVGERAFTVGARTYSDVVLARTL